VLWGGSPGAASGIMAPMSEDSVEVIADAIRGFTRRDVVAVALDGFSGAGKSTLAHRLADQLDGAVIEGDDFYRVMDNSRRWALGPAEGVERYFDWERLRDEALTPMRSGRMATYSPFDWATGGGLSRHEVSVGPASVIIVEGVYSARPELAPVIDLAVLVDTSQRVRDQRIASRNHGHDRWHSRWTAAERYYFEHMRPRHSFDVVVPGE